jgi:SAM-dependent methyltransferase
LIVRDGTTSARSTNTRSDGYVLDVAYTESMFTELNPAMFSMAAVLHGQPPLDFSQPLTWVELGCGNGLTACAVAAANPDIEVWACDLNPRHIERAREIATRAELDNCRFDEASFEEVASGTRFGPLAADVIVAHGVFTWISRRHQHDLGEIIAQRLRPGGWAYVSTNAASGWSSLEPLAEAMRLAVAADGRRRDLAFPDAVSVVQQLADAGANYFPIGPRESATMSSWNTIDPRYGVHEYIVAGFGPVTFDRVAEVMDLARCIYVGSLGATDHLSHLWVPPELSDLVLGTTDVTTRELLRDLIVQPGLRRDLYRRGLAISTPLDREAWQRGLRVVGLGATLDDHATVPVPAGSVALDPVLYGPLVATLADRSLGIEEIETMHPGWALGDATAGLGLLVAGGFAVPEVPGWQHTDAPARCRRLNEVLIAENRVAANHQCLVAPATGGAIASESFELLTLGALWEGSPADVGAISDEIERSLQRSDRLVRENYQSVTDPADARVVIERRVTSALTRSEGPLRHLGIS